jgi:MFS family permease
MLAGVIISFYGGGFATVPAYLRDLFGAYQVGAIHGRLLTAWSAAGVAGPLITNRFLDAQGKPGRLVAADYLPALFTMVGVLAVGFLHDGQVLAAAVRRLTRSVRRPTCGGDRWCADRSRSSGCTRARRSSRSSSGR